MTQRAKVSGRKWVIGVTESARQLQVLRVRIVKETGAYRDMDPSKPWVVYFSTTVDFANYRFKTGGEALEFVESRRWAVHPLWSNNDRLFSAPEAA